MKTRSFPADDVLVDLKRWLERMMKENPMAMFVMRDTGLVFDFTPDQHNELLMETVKSKLFEKWIYEQGNFQVWVREGVAARGESGEEEVARLTEALAALQAGQMAYVRQHWPSTPGAGRAEQEPSEEAPA